MSRKCTVCKHKERAAIDTALLGGASFRDLAGQFRLSKTSLCRHKGEHLPRELSKAHEAHQISAADDLLRQVQDLQTSALTILRKAEEAGDLRTALGAIREARGNLELLAKLVGELKEGQTVSIIISSEWQKIRSALMESLISFPEARAAAANRLLLLEGEGEIRR